MLLLSGISIYKLSSLPEFKMNELFELFYWRYLYIGSCFLFFAVSDTKSLFENEITLFKLEFW